MKKEQEMNIEEAIENMIELSPEEFIEFVFAHLGTDAFLQQFT